MQKKIKELDWETIPHPPYSRNMASSDYHLFESLQHYLEGKRFAVFEDEKKWVNRLFLLRRRGFIRVGIGHRMKWSLLDVDD